MCKMVSSREEFFIFLFTSNYAKYLLMLVCNWKRWKMVWRNPKKKKVIHNAIIPRKFTQIKCTVFFFSLAIAAIYGYSNSFSIFLRSIFSFFVSIWLESLCTLFDHALHTHTLTRMMHCKEQIRWEEREEKNSRPKNFLFFYNYFRPFVNSIVRDFDFAQSFHDENSAQTRKSVFGSRWVSSRNPQSKFKIFLLANDFFF